MKSGLVKQLIMLGLAAAMMAPHATARDGQPITPDLPAGESVSSAQFANPIVLAQQQQPPVRRPVVPVRPQQQPARSPEELGNQARPQTGETAGEPISIDFEDAPLMQVVELIGAQTGRNFEVDQSLRQQTVTIISHHPVPPEFGYQVLESILASRGFAMIETLNGNLIKIMPIGTNPGTEKLEIRTGLEPPDGYDDWSINVIRIRYADAQEVSEILKAVSSNNVRMTVYPAENMIIVADTADGIRNMLKLLEQIDLPGNQAEVEIFTLEYTRAEQLITQIQEVLGDIGSGEPGAQARQAGAVVTPQRVATRAIRPQAAGQAETQIVGQRNQILRMVPDERLNALIVVATPGLMEQTRFLIEELDSPTQYESDNLHLVELLNANAEAVEEALVALTGTTPRAAGGPGGGAGAAAEIQPFEKQVNITRYEQTNALLILATPQDFRKIKHIIDLLDVPRRQVNIESVIMEVTINDRFSLSVETAGLTANSAFALNNVVQLANAIVSGPFAVAGPGTTIGIVDGTTQVPVPTGIDENGLPTGLTLQTIPNVPLLVSALESITDVEVLSQPNILTLDNETGNIVSGQEIPLISSLSDVNQQSGFLSRSRVERTQTGVRMEVTPQINEGDYVAMEINVEVSQPVQSTIGIDPNQVGATIQKSEVTGFVVVGDGQTGILGGLLREGVDKTVNQAPFLGDLPLFGWLFRNKVNARSKQNLVILVTPHIVREGHDMDRLTDFRMGEFYENSMDVVFEKLSYIKKIQKKHEMRNQYRPTERLNPESPTRVRRNFSRGNISR